MSDCVSFLLGKWFPSFSLDNLTENNILTPFENRRMNQIEQSFFDIDFNCFENITIGQRLRFKRKVYHSTSYERLSEKGSDHVIKYLKGDSSFSYAIICYFLQIDDIFLLAVNELRKQNYLLGDVQELIPSCLLHLKNNGVFSKYFVHVFRSEQLSFISAEQIIHNCAFFKHADETFVVIDFFINTEHD